MGILQTPNVMRTMVILEMCISMPINLTAPNYGG